MPKVSVIVPVYNVEKYLCRCIDSILAQTFTDFELLLVDDGSPDNCPAICDEYAQKDARIQVIHKENSGVSMARNAALEIATGEFLTFCDSDDYWKPQWLEWLISQMHQNDADVVIGNYIKTDDSGQTDHYQSTHKTGCTVFSSQTDRISYIIQQLLCGFYGWEIWTRLFRTDIIQNNCIRFCTTCGNFAEDLEFVLEYMLFTRSVYSGDYAGYCYCQRSDSMMSCSRHAVKLNEVNEVSYCFWVRFCQVISDQRYIRQYPIIHFLILANQYKKMLSKDGMHNLPEEIKKISKHKWYRKETKQIFLCYKSLKRYLGKNTALRIFLFAHYCLHCNWKWYAIESAVLYKWILGGDTNTGN